MMKFVLVGDTSVAKTQILSRFSEEVYHIAAPGDKIRADFMVRSIKLDGKKVKLEIWDTIGNPRYHSLLPMYLRRAEGIMLIYDICNAKSFDSITRYHEEIKRVQYIRNSFKEGVCDDNTGLEVECDKKQTDKGNNCHKKTRDKRQVNKETGKRHAPRDVEIMLLGNNCHMKDKRQVNKETGKRYAAEHGMKFMEVSALAGINIEEAFSTLARTIKDTNEGATGSDECGSDELRTENAFVVQ